jgi:alpha-acetolactate decarboxylase
MSYFSYPSKEVKNPFLKPLVWKEILYEELPTFIAKCSGETYYLLVYDKRCIKSFNVSYCYKAWDKDLDSYSVFTIFSADYPTKVEAENAIEQCRHKIAKEMLSKEAIAKLKQKNNAVSNKTP